MQLSRGEEDLGRVRRLSPSNKRKNKDLTTPRTEGKYLNNVIEKENRIKQRQGKAIEKN